MGSKVTVKCFRYVERCQKIFFHKVRKNPGLGGEVSQNNPGSGGKLVKIAPVAKELKEPKRGKKD